MMAGFNPLVVIIVLFYQQLVLGDLLKNCNLNLHISNKNKSYDLTSVAFEAVNVTGRRSDLPAVATIQLCSAPGPCVSPAAACITATASNHSASQPLVANAGRIDTDTALVVKDSSQLQLDLAPGQPCTSQGRNTTFQTSILFICESSIQGSAERLQAVMGDCSLLVMWYTADACSRAASDPPSCSLLAYRPYRGRPGLAALSTSRWRVEADGAVFEVVLCGRAGRKDGPCAGAPLCVTDPARTGGQPVPVGSSERPARLSATNGSVTLTYGQQGEDRVEVLLQCREEAGAGRLVFRRRHEHLVQLTLETAVVCPVRQVECRVTAADGTPRDLSRLIRLSGGWETMDRTEGQSDAAVHFYINMCRALNHDRIRKLCGGVPGTAVCMQSGDDEPVSLGTVTGPPTLKSDGSIVIVYTNGSQCAPGGDRFSSELQLVCGGPEDGEPVLLAKEDRCRYSFLWETAAACGQQESSGGQCALSEPLYGHRLDVSSLRRTNTDYVLQLDDHRTLYLNLCGPLVRRCGGAGNQGACLVNRNGTETSYGGASSRLRHSGGVLSLTMTGGARCGPAANYSTHVVFTCDQQAAAAVEPGLVHLGGGCTAYVVVPARQACPPRRAGDCRTMDGRFDLSGLTTQTGNHVYHELNATYVLNVCQSVNPEEGVNCPPESGACLVQPSESGAHHRYTSLGAVSGGPVVDGEQLVLRYNSSEPCAAGDIAPPRRHRSTEIRFTCDPAAQGTQPRLVSSDGCLYQFAWTTAHACPLEQARGTANCTVQNPQTGYRFDLSPLSRRGGHSVSLLGFQYQLNVCTALTQPGNCTAGTGVCKTTAVNPSTKRNVGMANDNLIYDDGLLLLNYSGGAPCGGGRRYSTVISFICGPEVGEPGPHVVEDDLCTVSVHWPTHLACESRVACTVDTPDGLVDLTGLVRPGGTVVAAGSGSSAGERFTVNVCRPLGPSAGLACPAGSAACHVNGTEYQGLGHMVSPPRLQSDHVTVTYEHGSPCAGQPGRNLTSELQLYCDTSRPVSESRPDWPQLSDCRYTFQWRTAAACPLSPAAAQARRQCSVQRPDGTVSDLNTLTAAHTQQVPFSGQVVRLRPCQTDQQCGGAVCVGNLSYGDPASFTVHQTSGQFITLEYSTDAACTQSGGNQTSRGATLRLNCDPALGRGSPTVTQVTACHVTVLWRSSAVCSAAAADGSGGSPADIPAPPAVIRGTGHVLAWLLVAGVAAVLVLFLSCHSRWRAAGSSCACCQMWGALRRQLLSPGTRATAHYRPVRVEDPDDAETALLLDTPLDQQQSPRPAVRRRPGQSPTLADMTDVCLDPSCDSDDELLLV